MEEWRPGLDEIVLRMLQLRQKGYCCSQILLILALDSEHKTNTDLVRAARGLCYGMGSGEVCGCLSAGVRCDDILTQHPDKSACGAIVVATYRKAMEILAAHDRDPGRGRHG